MRIRLLKSWDNGVKKFLVGRILTTTCAARLIEQGIAIKYDGPYPPLKGRKGKMKINLKDITHGSSNR